MNHRERALHLVTGEIAEVVERPACPQCRSTWIKDHGIPGARGSRWNFRQCQDCDFVFDAELDAVSAVSDELNAMVSMFDAVLADIDDLLRRAEPEDLDIADACQCKVTLGSASLGLVRERLDNLLGDALGKYETTVPGVGVVKRHHRKNRTAWDKDDLLRAVLDTKLVNTATGEIVDETPLAKVLTVWNLSTPRLTALRDRGLDADDFCRVEERPGWTVEIR